MDVKQMIRYIFWGGMTTLVNVVTYWLGRQMSLSMPIANALSWLVAVTFAFFTNKHLVFKSQTNRQEAIKEFALFFGLRLASLALDMGLMIALIQGLRVSELIAKLVTQVAVIVANYVFSKLYIFKGKE